jgi:hypothetical protein
MITHYYNVQNMNDNINMDSTIQSMFMVNQLIVVKVEYVAYWALLFGQVARCTRYNYMGFNSAVLVC